MPITEDLSMDWNAIPEMGSMLPAGIVKFMITDFTDQMSSEEGGKIAKKMLVGSFTALEPPEAAGMTKKDWFVIGSDTDPKATGADTVANSVGGKRLKDIFTKAQVPFHVSLASTCNSAIGAQFLAKINHKSEKRRDGAGDFISDRFGTTFKIGERPPVVEHCKIPDCPMCGNAGGGGQTGTVPALPSGNLTMPQMTAPPAMPAPTAAPPPVMPSVPAAPPVDVAPPPVMMPAPVATPAAPSGPALTTPPATTVCSICKAAVPNADFGKHVQECSKRAAAAGVAQFAQQQ